MTKPPSTIFYLIIQDFTYHILCKKKTEKSFELKTSIIIIMKNSVLNTLKLSST